MMDYYDQVVLALDYVQEWLVILQDSLISFNIKETYIIACVLSLIVCILWCLLRCKGRPVTIVPVTSQFVPSPNLKSAGGGSGGGVGGGVSGAGGKKNRVKFSNEQKDDGYLSDSALNFLANFGRSASGPRFRKRDKLYFYGKKMLRQVSTVKAAEKSKNFYKIISKKILNRQDDYNEPQYRRAELPEFLLDIDSYDQTKEDHNLPSALINLIRSVKVFGYFDQKIILEMCKYMETKTVYANNYLFKIGEPDDSIYVVESGRINVYITDEKGRKHLIKECTEGSHIFSLLSIMDVLTGDIRPYKTVSAKAVEDTSILRLPGKAFVEVLQKYPDYLVRITQIIIVRLQRVTFAALHSYLGLTSEIINQSLTKPVKRSGDSGSKKSGNKSHHHHHHHYHHYHRQQQNSSKQQRSGASDESLHGQAGGASSATVSIDESNSKDLPGRKYSIPLPPVSFFDYDSSVQNENDFTQTHLSTAKQTSVASDDQNAVPRSPPKRSSEHHKSNDKQETNASLEPHYLKPASERKKKKSSPVGGKMIDSTVNSTSEFESQHSSTSYESQEDGEGGSEYGDDYTHRDIQKKLPLVQNDIAKVLKLDDPEVLKNKLSLVRVSEGTIVCREGDYNCGLMFVLEGQLNGYQKELDGEESTVFSCMPNQFCGNLSAISGEPSLFTIKAKTDTEFALISKENFHKIIAYKPQVVLSIAHFIVKRMSPFVRQIDFALEWNMIEAGNVLFRQDVKAENIYIVLNGRLRSILKKESNKQLVGEFGRGDLVGLVEILMETNNATTVVAIRDTEVAQIPTGLLNYIKYRHPRVVTRLIQMLSSKLLGTIQNNTSVATSSNYIDTSYYNLTQQINAPPTIASNLCTVAILPVSDDVPLHAFTMKLAHALKAIDSTLLLTKDLIVSRLGPTALDRVNEYRLCAWLGQQEDHHRIVLYQCENSLTPWSRRCMRQADCLLIVGLASNEPNLGQLEKEIDNFAIRAQKELILLHRMDGSRPTNTVKWLSARSWCSSHHHIRCPDKLLKTKNNEKLIKTFQTELGRESVDKMTDFSRLARFLTGTSIGIVLGGGGARGAAHVGMIKAMKEANVPIDMIGGTSIGSFMGALYAEEMNYERFHARASEWAKKMTYYYKQAMDLTYPVTSMFTGNAFNNSIREVFGDRQIEDLWIPYFCVTTDISSSKMRIHTNGYLWRYVRASMTYCWLFPPMCDPYDGHLLVDGCYVNNVPGNLWRYVRSSMSLSGYLPPLCDPMDGHLLLDGGYVNNLPADVMHRMGVNIVLAIDVGSKDDDNFTNYGDQLSGWWLLYKKWNPWSTPVKVPDLTEIQSRLAYVSCQRGLEMVKNSDYCEYMRPPIDRFRTLQFGSFDEIFDCGLNYGRILFDTWIRHAGSVETFLYQKKKITLHRSFSKKDSSSMMLSSMSDSIKSKGYSPSRRPNLSYDTDKFHFEDLSSFVYSNQTAEAKQEASEILAQPQSSRSDGEDEDGKKGLITYKKIGLVKKNGIKKQMSLDGEDEGEDEIFECYYIGEDTDSNIDSNNESFDYRPSYGADAADQEENENALPNESASSTANVTLESDVSDHPKSQAANTLLESVKVANSMMTNNHDTVDPNLISLINTAGLNEKQ